MSRARLTGVACAVTAVTMMAIGLLLVTLRANASFPQGSTRLSDAVDVCDIEPRTAISADGSWLAAAWIRGKMISGACKAQGQAVVRWATEEAGQTHWHTPVNVTLPGGACAIHVDIALQDTIAHVVSSYWEPCDAAQANSGLRYTVCDLETGACDHQEVQPAYQTGAENRRLSDVRIAVDSQGRPHLAYARGTHGLGAGDILYTRYADEQWMPPTVLSNHSAVPKIHGFYRPVIAVSDGRVHVAWERHRNYTDDQYRPRSNGDVVYRSCPEDGGACGYPRVWTAPSTLDETTYPLPTLDAKEGEVIITWQLCGDYDYDPPCEQFYLVYARSRSNGDYWLQPREVGTENPINWMTRAYPGSDQSLSMIHAYAAHTRPSVTLDSNQLPRIAWQLEAAAGYEISSTRATEAGQETLTWVDPDGAWRWDGAGDQMARIAPVLLTADPVRDADGVHLIYMRAWTELVGSQMASRSQVYYDYAGARLRSLVPDTPAGGTPFSLPAERATELRVRVVKEGSGDGVNGVPVTFSTDHGSFSHQGYGSHSAQVVSDSDGWASATLYANLPGEAIVNAWLDYTPDGVRASDEPATALTRTWVDEGTPSLHLGVSWANVGDLITTTLAHHPYETPDRPGAATRYMLYWCSTPAGSDPVEVAGPLTTAVETWSIEDMVIEVPTSSGAYYLESRDDGEHTPCSPGGRIATSGAVEIRETLTPPPVEDPEDPPPPWISVADNRPDPGATIMVTLHDHSADRYALWWCPASPNARPISQKLAQVTVPGEHNPFVSSIQVPFGTSGLYRIESHTDDGGCGAPTRQAQSPLLNTTNRVFLPLITRGAP